MRDKRKVVFRCIGGKDVGWGHVLRCLNLAQWLHAKYKTFFVIDQDEDVAAFIKEKGFTVFEVAYKGKDEKFEQALLNTIIGLEPYLVVNDMLDTTPEYMQALKAKKYKIVNIDDTSTSAKFANVLIDANKKEKEKKCLGPKFMVLNSLYAKLHKKKSRTHKVVKNVLISFGGSDPDNLTLKTLQSLEDVFPEKVDVNVILGPSYKKEDTLSEFMADDSFSFHTEVDGLSDFISAADLAIVGGGITMFECLCLGTPSIVIAENKAQAKNARRMVKYEAVEYLGVGGKISVKKIMRKVTALVDDADERERLASAGRNAIDGKGIFRVLEEIEKLM